MSLSIETSNVNDNKQRPEVVYVKHARGFINSSGGVLRRSAVCCCLGNCRWLLNQIVHPLTLGFETRSSSIAAGEIEHLW